jgi:hypothetical protein
LDGAQIERRENPVVAGFFRWSGARTTKLFRGIPVNDSISDVRSKVSGPAIGLIIAVSLSLGLLMLGLIFSVWLLVSGVANDLPEPIGMTKETQISIRIAINVLVQFVNVFVLFGAVRMKRLRSLNLARTACVLAMVPCFGPCCLLGLPFGIWGLVVLSDTNVQQAFES